MANNWKVFNNSKTKNRKREPWEMAEKIDDYSARSERVIGYESQLERYRTILYNIF